MVIHYDGGGLIVLASLSVLGFIQALLAAAPAISGLLGGAAKGRAEGRVDEAKLLSDQDRNRLYGYNTQQEATTAALTAEERAKLDRAALEMARRKYALDAPTTKARQAALGDLMANVQDFQMKGGGGGRVQPMQFAGGLRPSALGPNARGAGAEMSRQALMSMLAGEKFDDVAATDFRSGILKPPTLSKLPQASGLDKFLNVASFAAALPGTIGKLGNLGGEPSEYVDWKGKIPTHEGKPFVPKNF